MKRVGQVYREKLSNRIKTTIEKSESVFVVTYSNLSTNKLNDLRKSLSQAGADVFVSKNAVAQVALKELKHDVLADRISGQMAFIWNGNDSAEVSKILVKFVKDCENLKLQGGVLDGRVIEQADVKRLSDLPSRQVLLAQLLGTIQAPLTRLAGALNGKTRELLSILKQLSEKKGGN